MRLILAGLGIALTSASLAAQAPGKWPPDSLINVKVFPRSTPVMQVVGAMRNVAMGLGVRCQYCHVGEEGMSLDQFDFAKDEKRTKAVARQMMLMVQEINKRLDTIPERPTLKAEVTCLTCHRGVSRPLPLETILQDAATVGGTDSAVRVYRTLRERYYGRAAYDFGEPSLSIAAFRLGRANKFEEANALLRLNEEYFPTSSGIAVFRGNINLMRGDTTAGAVAFREALRRDPNNNEARGRLRDIGRQP